MNVAGSLAIVEATVAMILKDREILRGDMSSEPSLGSELAVVLKDLLALLDTQPRLLGHAQLAELLAAGLDGKVGLTEGDDLLCRVGVLNDEVAGVAREVVVGDRVATPAAALHHFIRSDKVIGRHLLATLAGLYRIGDHLLEFLPALVG